MRLKCLWQQTLDFIEAREIGKDGEPRLGFSAYGASQGSCYDALSLMIIASIAAAFPSLRVTNTDLVKQFNAANQTLSAEERTRCSQAIENYLTAAGAEIRFYRDRARGERAYSFLRTAIHKALEQAEIRPKELDLLIYCGVGRGFLEPAMAYFLANDLGISCECFDILDACMSWVRALYVVYHLFASRRYSTALVVNGEFNIYEWGYPSIMKVKSSEGLRSTLPAYTIGEAASATVLKMSESKWNFRFRSNASALPLCAVPLTSHNEYSPRPEWNLAPNGSNTFMCYGEELTRFGAREMLRFVRETYPDPSAFQKWFPHAATGTPYRRAADTLGLNGRLYSKTFARYGNVVSASIPVGLSTASQEDELKRGDRIVLCPISAGMSMALVDFIF